MRRTELLQEIRKMRFEEAYGAWEAGWLTQTEAARLLGVCDRTFRRYLMRYEADGLEALVDRRLEQFSHRKAPVDAVRDLSRRTGGDTKAGARSTLTRGTARMAGRAATLG